MVNKNKTAEEYRETIRGNQRRYRERHREEYNAYHKEYRARNIEHIQEDERARYEQLRVPYNCPCGSSILLCSKGAHEKTNKHRAFLLKESVL